MKPAALTTVCLVLSSFSITFDADAEEAFLPCPDDVVFSAEFFRNHQIALESHTALTFDPSVRTTTRTHSNWMRRLSGTAFEWTWTHGFEQKPLARGQVIEVEKTFFLKKDLGQSIAMVLDPRTAGGMETFTLDLLTSAKMSLGWFEKKLRISFLCKKIE